MNASHQDPKARQAPGAPPTPEQSEWLAARIGGRFFLEAATAISDAFDSDVLHGVILLTVIRQNLSDVPGLSIEDDVARQRNGLRAVGPRRAATVYGVAKALGLNYETTRRHIRRLVEDGYCVRCPDGVVACGDIVERPEIARTMKRLSESVHRLTSQLRAAGLSEV
ncbi:MAG: hypothetical protein JSS35_07280 [Proteobacteria bacterium]|nr:hypothetical protein [Pseudomonadota bacterium]